MYSLKKLLLSANTTYKTFASPIFTSPGDDYLSPGYWVACVVKARRLKLEVSDLPLVQSQIDYAKTLRIEEALGGCDTYPHQRINAGKTYSPLVSLQCADDVDTASQTINNCLRSLFPEQHYTQFIGDLCDVVGDLHDNVWSHGNSTGISMAQRWTKPKSDKKESYIEFALADCGMGFLKELNRSGIALKEYILDDRAAIEWCIQQGNSSKKIVTDEWEQRLPSDTMGNPIGKNARPFEKDNHHQGLGLHKMMSLVKKYGGELSLATGSTLLVVDRTGANKYIPLPSAWDGVAISCRFCTDKVRQVHAEQQNTDSEIDMLLQELWR